MQNTQSPTGSTQLLSKSQQAFCAEVVDGPKLKWKCKSQRISKTTLKKK
jgi:hypothetical protein